MRLVLNMKGFRELRNSPGVIADIEARAQRIAEAAGAGVDTKPPERGKRRARVAVVADITAMRREASTRDVTRALDAGR